MINQPNKISIIRELGKGSYGSVYLIEDGENKKYAMKILNDNITHGISSLSEIDILRKFVHPNLTTAINIQTIINPKYKNGNRISKLTTAIIMPLAISDLKQYIIKQKLNIETKIKIIFDILAGMKVLHDNNILHLDLKLDNILIYEEKKCLRATVSDFSLAIYTDKNGNRYYDRELVTITYRAPELFISRKKYDRKVDIWSMGLIFLKILSGELKIFTDHKRVRNRIYQLFDNNVRRKNIENYLKDIDSYHRPYLIDMLDQMLSIDPINRPTIDEIIKLPIFSDLSLPEYIVNFPILSNCNNINSNHYLGFDYIFRICYAMNIHVETLFLCIDIFHRCLNLCQNSTFENILLLFITCFWISVKMNEYIYLTTYQLTFTLNNSITDDQISNTEKKIIIHLDGIIYRPNIFTSSTCRHCLLNAFELSRNFNIFPFIDLNLWLENCNKCQYKSDICYDEQFQTFYVNTQYYSYIQSFNVNDPKTYIDLLFNHEFNN